MRDFNLLLAAPVVGEVQDLFISGFQAVFFATTRVGRSRSVLVARTSFNCVTASACSSQSEVDSVVGIRRTSSIPATCLKVKETYFSQLARGKWDLKMFNLRLCFWVECSTFWCCVFSQIIFRNEVISGYCPRAIPFRVDGPTWKLECVSSGR